MGFTVGEASGSPTSKQVSSGTQTAATQFSKPIQEGVASALDQANTAFTKPWAQLDASKYIAPTNAAQTQYFANTRNLTGPAQYDQSGNLYTGVGGSTFDQAQAQRYMDPYQQAVTDTTMAELQRQYDRQKGQRGLEKARGQGLGSSGYVLAQALADKEYGNLAASTYAQLQQQAYQNAVAQYNAEKNRQIQAAQGLASLGSNVSSSDLARLQQQGLAATDEYNLAQRLRDLQLSEAKLAREAPMTMASNYANIIAGLPRELTETQTTQDIQDIYGTDPSTLNTILGLIGTGGEFFANGAKIKEGMESLLPDWLNPFK
jgi:hypothetical protein